MNRINLFSAISLYRFEAQRNQCDRGDLKMTCFVEYFA